ncbi:hypothetical protein A6D6_01864 [Alcanivorax xiamenensis]|uniref:RiboL-PSP-HEPN domain-containing protein n=1 Tax=Alcanivorax xiamenensis TaxID=1177156 RepID=A0ABQ6Y8S5_9GAMM|nr:HEPN domain-containing protein [Alcanivorax xiamenensis]KAF0806046.1 hypothetical protein A6D6_01864 [Alcanivorax xiamenensis]
MITQSARALWVTSTAFGRSGSNRALMFERGHFGMSISYEEAQQQAAYEEFVDSLAEELYDKHRDQAIEEFVTERLKSYYERNSSIAVNALKFLETSESLLERDPTASLLYSSIATEVILKAVMLKPIVSGLVHSESISELVATALTKQTGVDRFRDLIFKILEVYVEVDEGAAKYSRPESEISLWKERELVQKVRNSVAHRAEFCDMADAQRSLAVANEFYSLTERLISALGFQFDSAGEIRFGVPGQQAIL